MDCDFEQTQCDRNLDGIECEKQGNIDEAIRLYEQNVSEGFIGSHPYDRLAIIYHKQKRYYDERRVLEQAVRVFGKNNSSKLEHFKARLDKVNNIIISQPPANHAHEAESVPLENDLHQETVKVQNINTPSQILFYVLYFLSIALTTVTALLIIFDGFNPVSSPFMVVITAGLCIYTYAYSQRLKAYKAGEYNYTYKSTQKQSAAHEENNTYQEHEQSSFKQDINFNKKAYKEKTVLGYKISFNPFNPLNVFTGGFKIQKRHGKMNKYTGQLACPKCGCTSLVHHKKNSFTLGIFSNKVRITCPHCKYHWTV